MNSIDCMEKMADELTKDAKDYLSKLVFIPVKQDFQTEPVVTDLEPIFYSRYARLGEFYNAIMRAKQDMESKLFSAAKHTFGTTKLTPSVYFIMDVMTGEIKLVLKIEKK